MEKTWNVAGKKMVVRFFLPLALLLTGCGFDAAVHPPIVSDELSPPASPTVPTPTSLKLIEYNETLNLKEGDKTVLIIFSDKNAPEDLELSWTLTGNGADFAVLSGNTLLESGKKSFSISLDVLNDTVYNPNRSYVLKISSTSQKIENSLSINVNILENDPQYLIRFGAGSLAIKEGDPTLQIPVLLNTSHPSSLNVEYLISGSGVSGTDYTIAQAGLVQIPAGQTQSSIEISVPDDFVVENPKDVVLTLYRVSEVGVEFEAPSQITVQLNDNDLAISPVASTVLTQESLQFTVSGGDGNYIYTLLSPGGSQINSQGLFTAGSTAELLTVRIQDGSGLYADSRIEVIDPKANTQLGLWLKADALSLNNNDPVVTWEDQTTNARNFSQGTASARPTFVSNQINGKPVIRFDGVNDVLNSTYVPVTGNGTRSITTVLTNLSFKADSTVFSWGSTNSFGDGFGLIAMSPSSNSFISNTFGTYLHLAPDTVYPSSSFSPVRETPYIVTLQYDGTKLLYYVNGEAKGSTTWALATKSSNAMRIGSRFSTGFFRGDIAELLLHQELLSATEREQIECYLGRKYKIAVKTSFGCSSEGLVLPYSGNLSLTANEAHTIQVHGGRAPYRFTLLSGNGSVHPTTGLFTAASTPGVNRIRVEDTWGNGAELSVHVTSFPRPLSWLDLSVEESLSNNQSVPVLRDKSGRQNNWVQLTESSQPIYLTNQISSLPVLQFNGNQFLSGTFVPPTSNLPRTFAMVLTEAQSGNVFEYGSSYTCNGRFTLKVNPANTLDFERQCTVTSSSAVTIAEPQIILVKYTGTQVQVRRNGVQILSVTTALSTYSTYAIRLGGNRTGTAGFFSGKIAEFISFDSNLTDEQQNQVESYLSNKFNIALP